MPTFAPPPPPKDGEAPLPQIDFSKIIRDPDEAGERVVRGIKRGDLYILTHSEFKEGWDARAAAISKAFPDEPINEDFKKIFSMLAYNPIFEKQTEVPAYKK